MSIYGFRSGPAFRGASHADQIVAALDQPMGRWSTFWNQVGGGALESFGLGTAIRDFSIPQGTEPRQVGDPERIIPNLDPITTAQRVYEGVRGWFNPVADESEALSQEDWRASPWFRQDIPWDEGMTANRAAALAEWYDRRMVREHFAQFRPITSFLGNFGGQALDPINYIPVAGPAVRGAAAVRFGAIRGLAAVSALDAMANTAAFGLLTQEARAEYGDIVGWEMLTSEIAMSALIGGAFGAIGGALSRRIGQRQAAEVQERLSTLENTQQARVVLNEAIDGMANEGQVSLSPNGARAVDRMAAEVSRSTPEARGEVEFTTSRGSRYVLHEDGTTTRNKAARSDPGHEGDSGDKPRSARTVFLDENASVLSAAGMSNLGAKGARVVIRDGRASLLTWNEQAGRWGVMPDGRDIPVHMEPSVGRYPLELWGLKDDVPGFEAYSRMHAGNAIDAISGARPVSEGVVTAPQDTAGGISSADPGAAVRAPTNIRPGVSLDNGAAPEPPTGLSEAAARSSRPEDIASEQSLYRVNRETGDYLERGEIEQLRAEGRLTEEDAAMLDEQRELFDQSQAFARALDAAVTCII